MALTKNEENFVRDICTLASKIAQVLEQVELQYGLLTVYDEEKGLLKIVSNSINESLNVARAKQFIEGKINPEFIEVVF